MEKIKIQKERFLITGVAGFVGACLARRLLGEGCRVSVLIKPSSNLWRVHGIENKLDIHRGDLTDKTFVRKAVNEIQPTVIYHLAAHGAYSTQNDAEKIILTNVLGTWNLLNALSAVKYKVFVNTGSSSEYGFKKSPMRETDLLEPNSYYAVAKSAQTLLCQYVARSQKRPITTFRLFSVYGDYEEPARLVPTLIRSCFNGQKINMVSPRVARDFIFIDDVIEAFLRLNTLSRLRGEVLNIGTGRQVTMKEIVATVLKLTRSKTPVLWGKMQSRIWDTSKWVANPSYTQKTLKWKATTSLKGGLQKTIAWYQITGGKYWDDG